MLVCFVCPNRPTFTIPKYYYHMALKHDKPIPGEILDEYPEMYKYPVIKHQMKHTPQNMDDLK